MPKAPSKPRTRKSRATKHLEPIPFARIPDEYYELRVPNPSQDQLSKSELKNMRIIRFEPIGENRKKGFGLPLSDLLAQRGLKDPDTPIFEADVKKGKQTVTVSLHWPGYIHLPWTVDVELVHPSGATLTRKELGYALALQVEEFIDKCYTHKAFVSTEEAWSVGPSGFNMDTIRFWVLSTADDNIWYLGFHVLAPIPNIPFRLELDGDWDEALAIGDPDAVSKEMATQFEKWFMHLDG